MAFYGSACRICIPFLSFVGELIAAEFGISQRNGTPRRLKMPQKEVGWISRRIYTSFGFSHICCIAVPLLSCVAESVFHGKYNVKPPIPLVSYEFPLTEPENALFMYQYVVRQAS